MGASLALAPATMRRRCPANRKGSIMSASVIMLAVSAICFLLAVLEVAIGEIALVPLGLLFLAVGLLLERVNVGASVRGRDTA